MYKFIRKIYYLLDYVRRRFRRFPRGSIVSTRENIFFNIYEIKDNKSLDSSNAKKNIVVDPNLAFDVGAYIGNSIMRIKSLGFSEIVCFEPDPDNYSSLVRGFRGRGGLHFFNFAVSEKSGALMSLTSNRDCPWLNTLHQDWINGTRHEHLFNRTEKYLVNTITLDLVIESFGFIPGYIKIDVEGHELNVLKGLKYKPNLLSFEWISEKPSKNISVLNHLASKGFLEFYVCMEENIPELNCQGLSLEQCLIMLNSISSNDAENKLFGNIFAR